MFLSSDHSHKITPACPEKKLCHLILSVGATERLSGLTRTLCCYMQALEQLSEGLAFRVLQASPSTLDECLPQLNSHFRAVAVHAACPELAAEGSVVLKCDDLSLATCTAALHILSSLPAVNSLILRQVSTLVDFSEAVSRDALQFALALHQALQCNLVTLHVHFADITSSQVAVLLFSLARNTVVEGLHLSFPVLAVKDDEMLAGVLGQLTSLQHLHIDVRANRD